MKIFRHGLFGRTATTFRFTASPLRWISLALPLAFLAGCATPVNPVDHVSTTGPISSTTPSALAKSELVTTSVQRTDSGSGVPIGAPTVVQATMPAQVQASTSPVDEEVVEAPVPIDPLRPEVRLNLDDHAAQTDLWARVRRGFAMADLDGDLVHNREQWYATRPDYVQRMTERGSTNTGTKNQ